MDSSDNPYTTPSSAVELAEARHIEAIASGRSHADDDRLIRYAHLMLRLLGVFLLIDGIGSVVGGAVYVSVQQAAYAREGIEAYPDPYAVAWIVGGAIVLLAGIYLVVGGQWVIEKMLLPVSVVMRRSNDEASESQ